MDKTDLNRIILVFSILLLSGCGIEPDLETIDTENLMIPDRESLIPVDAVKMTPENDPLPPQLHSDEFTDPVPLPFPVNTRGLEDSAFILPDGQTLYVWFTPNNHMDVVEQSTDQATGIYRFTKTEDLWSAPERVWLAESDIPHLDGCGFFSQDVIWFCGARQGYEGMNWFTAEFMEGKWTRPVLFDFDPDYKVGELHFSNDGNTLYFHSKRVGGVGGLDIWVSRNHNDEWGQPENLSAVNSPGDEGWPALNPQENELWITKDYGIWRSELIDGSWQQPELIVSNLAGEASVDQMGNVYFTHHYFVDNTMVEADIYWIERK